MGEEKLENRKYSFAEYESLVEELDYKIEYHAGYIRAMAGATYSHNLIQKNLLVRLSDYFDNNDCETLGSDQAVKIQGHSGSLYPDISIVCGEQDLERNLYLNNPSVIVEVLSKSTAYYDEGKKKLLYFSIPSLKEYITVQTESPLISTHSKDKTGNWTTVITFGLKSKIHLPNFNLDIKMTDIYRNVKGLNEEF